MQEVGGSIPPGSTSLRWLRQLRLGKPLRSEGCRVVAQRAKTGRGKLHQLLRTTPSYIYRKTEGQRHEIRLHPPKSWGTTLLRWYYRRPARTVGKTQRWGG